jgi:hypothetical protein
MDVPPIPPVTFDALTAVAMGDGMREGRILEARVTALISNTLARLEINGQALVVAMPRPLPVGTALTLKVERDAGELKLVVQGQLRDVPEAAMRAPPLQRPTAILAEPVRAALAKIEAMVNAQSKPNAGPVAQPSLDQILASVHLPDPERPDSASMETLKTALARLSETAGRPSLEEAPPVSPARMPGDKTAALTPNTPLDPLLEKTADSPLERMLTALDLPSNQADTTPRQPGPHAMSREHAANDAAPRAYLANAASPSADDSGRKRQDTLEAPHFRVLSDATAAPGRIDHASTFVVEIPVFLPGTATPLRLHVTEHEEAETEGNATEHPAYWTVRFAAEAGRLGMVHASISLIDGHIGVQLWAERDETAEQFKLNAPQLREALQASDLKLDGVSIAQGSPGGR